MGKKMYGVESTSIVEDNQSVSSEGLKKRTLKGTPIRDIERQEEGDKSYKPNLKLLNDAIRDEMSMEELVAKYSQSPTNLVAKIRISLKLLATLVKKEVISEYMTDLEKMLEYRDIWIELMDMFVVKDSFDILPLERKFFVWFDTLVYEEQQMILNKLEKMADRAK